MKFSYDAPEELIGIPFVKFSAPVQICFDYELYEDDAMEIKGTIAFTLEGQCSRCLQPAKQDVVCTLDALFEPKKDAEDYSYFGGIIQLKQAVEECISANMPYILSCGDNCVALQYADEPNAKR